MGEELVPFKNSRGRSVGVQCSAKSKQTGNRCRRFTGHPYLTVCRFHGGASPVVRRAADRRLAELAPSAVKALKQILDDPSSRARFQAAKYVFKMLGINAKTLWEEDSEQKALPSGESPDDQIEALLRGLRDAPLDETSGQESDIPPLSPPAA
jgi:hypothetical protein